MWALVGGLAGVIVALAIVLVVIVASGGDDGGRAVTAGADAADETVDPPTTVEASAQRKEGVVIGTSSLPTTTVSTTTVPADPQAAAEAEMSRIANDQRSRADALVGFWVPQLDSKHHGIVDQVDGTHWTSETILANYRDYVGRFDDAILIRSSDFGNFQPGFWVVVLDRPFTNSDDALAWCAREGLDFNQCAAKLIGHTDGSSGSTVWQDP